MTSNTVGGALNSGNEAPAVPVSWGIGSFHANNPMYLNMMHHVEKQQVSEFLKN